jgi:hypothetical protein
MYGATINPNANGNGNANSAAIFSRVNASLANLRRDRDAVHRQRNLAQEGLGLIMQDRDSKKNSLNVLIEQLSTLEEQASGAAELKVKELEEKVTHLKCEVQFQHYELVSKREKLDALYKRMEEDAMERKDTISMLNTNIHRTREEILAKNNKEPFFIKTGEQVATIQREMDDCNSGRLWNEWPQIIENKATSVTTEATDLHRSSEELERILEGYKKHFGLSIDTGMNGKEASASATEK